MRGAKTGFEGAEVIQAIEEKIAFMKQEQRKFQEKGDKLHAEQASLDRDFSTTDVSSFKAKCLMSRAEHVLCAVLGKGAWGLCAYKAPFKES